MSEPIVVVQRSDPTLVVVQERKIVAVTLPRGPQGPPGPSGDSFVVHEQTTAASVWTIDHGLGRVPSWFVKESTGDELEPQRSDPSVNQTIFNFDGAAVSGTAYGS